MKLALVVTLALVLILAGCGGSSTPSNDVAGTWTATLTNSAGTTLFSFTTTLTQTSANTANGVTGSYSITNGATCFEEPVSENGELVTGTANTLALTIVGGSPGSLSVLDTLQLNGTVNGKTITGTWTLQGFSTCNGSGSFTMTRS